MRRVVLAAALAFVLTPPALAQGPVEVPNPMAAHTLFVIVITAAFLAWALSYSVQTMKERTSKKGRQALLERREAVLDEITAVEKARESGTISEARYKSRMKALRGELARVIERLESTPSKARKKPA